MGNDLQPSSVVMMSVLAIIAGIGLIYVIYRINRSVERDKFYRRNAAGIEEFDSFEGATKAQWKANAAKQFEKLFGTLAVLLIIGGGIGVAVGSSLPKPRKTAAPGWGPATAAVRLASVESLNCDAVSQAAVEQSRTKGAAAIYSVSNMTVSERAADKLVCGGSAIWADGGKSAIFIQIVHYSDGNVIMWSDSKKFQ